MTTTDRNDRKIWAFAGAAFLLLLVAWATLFTLAARNPVQSVPLEQRAEP